MGTPAQQMQAAIDADGGAGLVGGDAGVAPGTDGGSSPTPAAPPAGASNTDTAVGGGVPDTIPYARFKEVNDAYSELKDLKPLVDYGYDPDSLGQLAAFHQAYSADPVGTWKGMASDLDLPQEVKDAIERHLASDGEAPGSAQGTTATPPQEATELPDDVKRRLEYVDQLQAREAEAERNAQLDRVVSHWHELDKQDGLETPDKTILNQIAAQGARGAQFATVEDLVTAARGELLEYRTSVLGGAVRTGRTGAPLSVPGSAPAPAGPIKFGSDIRAATRAAEEAIKRGELPSL